MSNDDKNLDLLGVKPLGDAVNNLTTAAIDGVKKFLRLICSPAAEEFGLLLRDKVAGYRIVNLAKVTAKTKKKLEALGAEQKGGVSPKLLREIVEESSWVEDDTLQDLWAGLLAGTIADQNESDLALAYSNVLKELNGFQARILNMIYADPRVVSLQHFSDLYLNYHPVNPLIFSVQEILEVHPELLDNIVEGQSAPEILADPSSHPLALGKLMPQIAALKRMSLVADWAVGNGKTVRFWPSADGLDLYMRCTGYNLFPIETYVLTRQHWCKQRDVDPFSYRREEWSS